MMHVTELGEAHANAQYTAVYHVVISRLMCWLSGTVTLSTTSSRISSAVSKGDTANSLLRCWLFLQYLHTLCGAMRKMSRGGPNTVLITPFPGRVLPEAAKVGWDCRCSGISFVPKVDGAAYFGLVVASLLVLCLLWVVIKRSGLLQQDQEGTATNIELESDPSVGRGEHGAEADVKQESDDDVPLPVR